MSDRLKLTDLNGDAEIEKIAIARDAADANRRIEELERNVWDLEQLIAEKERLAWPGKKSTKRNNKIGARRNGSFKAVSTAPSINKTPAGAAMVPVAYPTIADLSNSVDVAKTVCFNGKATYTLGSTQPACRGDDSGTGGGVRSGTVNGEVKPTSASKTVSAEGRRIVRQGDANTMNSGNNRGKYIASPSGNSAVPKMAATHSNPPVVLQTQNERSAFSNWLDSTTFELKDAVRRPVEAVKGAVKGTLNTPSELLELLTMAVLEQRASELDDVAISQAIFGHETAGSQARAVADSTRDLVANVNLPKLAMSNAAQRGGEKISSAVQLFAGGVSVLKKGGNSLKRISKKSGPVDAVSRPDTISAQSRTTGKNATDEKHYVETDDLKSRDNRPPPIHMSNKSDAPSTPRSEEGVRVQAISLPDGIEANPNGVYGYMPIEGSRFAKFDFSDVDGVEKYRQIRIEYLAESKELSIAVDKMRSLGKSSQEIATRVVLQRNSQKIEARAWMKKEDVEKLEAGNIKLYGDPVGPTPGQLFEKYETWEKIIEKSMEKSPALNMLLGLPAY